MSAREAKGLLPGASSALQGFPVHPAGSAGHVRVSREDERSGGGYFKLQASGSYLPLPRNAVGSWSLQEAQFPSCEPEITASAAPSSPSRPAKLRADKEEATL